MATSTLHLGAGGAVSSLASRLTHLPCQVNHHIAPDIDFFVLSRVGIITAKLSHISVLPPGTYTLTHSVPRHLSRQWKVEEQTSPRHDHLIIHILPIRPSCLNPKGKQIQMPSPRRLFGSQASLEHPQTKHINCSAGCKTYFYKVQDERQIPLVVGETNLFTSHRFIDSATYI